MKRLGIYAIATACTALAGAAGLATNANAAQTCFGDTNCSLGASPYTFAPSDAFGGGSSLVAPYWRQISDCYANPADLMVKNNVPAGDVDEALFNWTGKNPQDCATQTIITNATTWYISTGSGSGLLSEMTHDPVSFWGQVNTNGPQYFPAANYALSDAGLGTTDLAAYNNGTGGGTWCQGTVCVSIAAPGAVSCTSGSKSPYPNPADCYGPMVQFPFSVDAVVPFYENGGIYEKVYNDHKGKEINYKFNVQNPNSNGGLRLSVSSLCGIYNGQITNWNDSRLTADNNGVSLMDPNDPTGTANWSVPLYAVARADSSGTTSIITRHLANVCAGFGYNLYTTGATTIQNAGAGSIVGNTYNVSNPNWPGVDISGKITLSPNAAGVAQYVAFTQSPASEGNNCPGATLPSGYTDCIWQARMGYNGADYLLPYVKSTHTNNYNLFTTTLQNAAGNWINPTPKAVLAALGSVQPPQSDSKGNYCSSCLNYGMRNDPTAWVEGVSKSEPLANPTGSGAYPDAGTTNFLGYTCYASSKVVSTIIGQLKYVESSQINTNAKGGVLGSAGFSALPPQWRTAVTTTFLTNKDGLKLNMVVAGSAGPCSGPDIVGG